MVYINKQGYLERKIGGTLTNVNDSSKRNWWFGKFGTIFLGAINIPQHLQGKRIMFKVVIKNQKGEEDKEEKC